MSIDQPVATITSLAAHRARRAKGAEGSTGGQFAPMSRPESQVELPAGVQDPWEPAFQPSQGRAQTQPLQTQPTQTLRAPGRLGEQIEQGLELWPADPHEALTSAFGSFADRAREGFGLTMESALESVDELTGAVQASAGCLPRHRQRQLA